MELQTINQVSKNYGVSAKMLRYYEQVGLKAESSPHLCGLWRFVNA
jgi:hypothetical protein